MCRMTSEETKPKKNLYKFVSNWHIFARSYDPIMIMNKLVNIYKFLYKGYSNRKLKRILFFHNSRILIIPCDKEDFECKLLQH